MTYIFVITIFIYFFFLLLLIFGLFLGNDVNKKIISNDVSIILCVKNGQDSLNNILKDLKSQIYNNKIEFIIVDDDSSDQTKQIILQYVKLDQRFKYVHSNEGDSKLSLKKRALDAGINNSQYDYLLFTDVDCRLNQNWVNTMMKSYNNGADYIIGCSIVKDYPKLVSKFQKFDFIMLMISALSSTNLRFPLACSGQNQSYKKELYQDVGFSEIANIIQGDDSIFMQLCKKIKKINVVFNLDKDSIVKSKPHKTWSSFLFQRIRWAGDANIMWRYNKIFFLIIAVTFLSNLFFILSPFLLFKYANIILLLLFVKFILEYLLYFFGVRKIGQKYNFIYFIYWFIIQIPYVVIVGLFSFFSPIIGWKGNN